MATRHWILTFSSWWNCLKLKIKKGGLEFFDSIVRLVLHA